MSEAVLVVFCIRNHSTLRPLMSGNRCGKAEGEGKARCGKLRLAALYHYAGGDIQLLTFLKKSKPCPDVRTSAACGPAPKNAQQSVQ